MPPFEFDFNFAEANLDQEDSHPPESAEEHNPKPIEARLLSLLKTQTGSRHPQSELTSLLADLNRSDHAERLDAVSLLQSVLSMTERGLVVLAQSAVLECSPITVCYVGADR